MAEFCLQCWNELNGTNEETSKYIIAKEPDLCEGCGEWTNVIIANRKYFYRYKLRRIVFLFRILGIYLSEALHLPHTIRKNKKR